MDRGQVGQVRREGGRISFDGQEETQEEGREGVNGN